MKKTMDQWHEEILKGSKKAFLPMVYYPVVPMTGLNAEKSLKAMDGLAMANIMVKTVEEIPETMFAMTAMDLAVDPEAFGCEILFREEGVPVAVSEMVKDLGTDTENLVIPGPHEGRQDLFYNAVKLAKEKITDRPVFGTTQGPFSLACTLYLLEDAMVATVTDSENLQKLVRKSTDFLKNRIRCYKEAGADGVMLCEATAGVISPKHRAVFSSAYIKEIVDEFQDENFHIYLHNCGRLNAKCQDLAETGVKGIQMGNWMDMGAVLEAMPEDVFILGNIDPMDFLEGSEETIRTHVEEILKIGRNYPNHVLATGCDVPYCADMDKIKIAEAVLKEYNESLN